MEAGMRAAAGSIVFLLIAACGGGGGGGGGVLAPSDSAMSPSPPPSAPSSFASAGANQTLVMEGTSATLTGSGGPAGSLTQIISAGATTIDAVTVKFTYDSARELSALSVSTPQASFSFDKTTSPGSVRCEGHGTCSAIGAKAHLTVMDPSIAGLNYQTFGVWGERFYHPFLPWNIDFSVPAWKIGAFSAGTPTTGDALPATGSAIFNGLAAGFYFDPTSKYPYATTAKLSANVNFGARNIAFSTSDTRRLNYQMGVQASDQGLNLAGTLSYKSGVNAFSGSVQTQNGLLNGQAAGLFYGPRAEEIGGVYSLQGNGVARMVGGFGGKR